MTYKEALLITKWFGEEFVETLPWDVNENLEIDDKLPIVRHSYEGDITFRRDFFQKLLDNPWFDRMSFSEEGIHHYTLIELIFNIPLSHRGEWEDKIKAK